MSIIVPPSGPLNSTVLLVGEAPGKSEAFHKIKGIHTPTPFVGKAGQEQEWYLNFFHANSKSWRKANVVWEYIDGNPDPTPETTAQWKDQLLSEVYRCNPRLTIAVGRFAMEWFLGPGSSLESCHGIPHHAGAFDPAYSTRAPEHTIIVPIHHPAHGFYKTRAKSTIFLDYKSAIDIYNKLQSGLDVKIPFDEYAGREQYHDVTGEELADIIDYERSHIDRFALDTEGYPGDRWSVQVSWQPGVAYCLRTSQDDANLGYQAIQSLADAIPVILHDASTPKGTGYDIQVCRPDIDLSRSTIINTMSGLYLLREFKGLKSAAWKFARMQMTDYMDVIGEASKPRQLEYFKKIVELKDQWPHPGQQLIREPNGEYRLTKPWPLHRLIAGKIKSIEKGELDKDGNPPNPLKKWEDLDRNWRIMVQRRLGPFPLPSLNDADLDSAIYYACRDADATLRIADPILAKIRELDREEKSNHSRFPSASLEQCYNQSNTLIPFWELCQKTGLPADRLALESLRDEMDNQCELIRSELSCKYYDMQPINPNSPDDTAKLIQFQKIPLRSKKTKTGNLKTDKKSIEYLRYDHPCIDLLFQFREHSHIKTSFAEVFLESFEPDELLHWIITCLDPAVTESRRLSSKEPNLLNVPSRTAIGRKVRSCFIAPEGWLFGSVDYSQIELRVIADETLDPVLCHTFINNLDPHRDYASYLFGRSDITYDERYFGKTMNFSVGYGMSPDSMYEQLQKEGQKQWTKDSCHQAHEAWYRRYAAFIPYKKRLIAEARSKGYVVGRGGMRRYLPNLRSDNPGEREEAGRHAVSHRIQETAQTIIQNATEHLKPIFQQFDRDNVPAKILLQYHDEYLFLAREDHAEMTAGIIKDAFENHCRIKLKVPIVTDYSLAKSWGEL